MRVTNKLNFTNALSNTMGGAVALDKIRKQISSGLKIQDSFEDASVYIDNTRLEYELKTLEQIKSGTNSAKEMTQNSMKALQDMSQLLENFKVKMTQAATDSNSQTSREAIAKELERIKENIVQLANTSINGQYLFSGAHLATKPFDSKGNYFGDKNNINVVTGAGTESPYNIPGYDLFFKADSDYKKQITTNISLTDNRYDLKQNPEKTTYLKADAPWKNLIGQGYVQDNKLDIDKDFEQQDTKLEFPPSALYVQGTKPDGISFKSAVLVGPEDKMEDVLEKIGNLYGNTKENRVVDIHINDSGQIHITDLKEGNNKLDFHAVAFTPQFTDKQNLQNIQEKMKQAQPAISNENLTNMIMQKALEPVPAPVPPVQLSPENSNRVSNLTNPVTITINNENFQIHLKRTDFIHSKMTDERNDPSDGGDYDNVFFEKQGNSVVGNYPQVIKGSNKYATEATKLSETTTLDVNHRMILQVQSKGGNTYQATINFANQTVLFLNQANPPQTISFPIMHTNPATGNSGMVTNNNDITYKQLNDIVGMFVSDKLPTQSITPNNGLINQNDYNMLQNLIRDSKATVDVSLDYKGRMSVTDRLSTGTNINVALYGNFSGKFPVPPYTTTASTHGGANLVFQANNALTIDEPNVDIIKDLDLMIEAVLQGDMRADHTSDNPRNTGMQGALERLDHLADHINKLNTTMGAYHNNIDGVHTRALFLSVNVQSIKSGVIDADYGESVMNLMQTQIAYQASLKASATIAQMSLLNYL